MLTWAASSLTHSLKLCLTDSPVVFSEWAYLQQAFTEQNPANTHLGRPLTHLLTQSLTHSLPHWHSPVVSSEWAYLQTWHPRRGWRNAGTWTEWWLQPTKGLSRAAWPAGIGSHSSCYSGNQHHRLMRQGQRAPQAGLSGAKAGRVPVHLDWQQEFCYVHLLLNCVLVIG